MGQRQNKGETITEYLS